MLYAVLNSLVLVAGLIFVAYLLWLLLFRRNSLRKRLRPVVAILGVLVVARIVIDAAFF